MSNEASTYMCSTSDWDALILRGVFSWRSWEMSVRHFSVRSDMAFLPWATWFDRIFRSLLNFPQNTRKLTNCSLPLSLSPLTRVRSFDVRMSPISLTNSSTLSSVLETQNTADLQIFWGPIALRGPCTESQRRWACVWIYSPTKRENIASMQKSTCLDSLCRAKQRKSSKYADHISWSRNVPIFHMASETLRKAVTEASDPKGKTLCLKILADPELGSYTAR